MLWLSCAIMAGVSAGLSALILLSWKYGKPCSGNYQPRTRFGASLLEAVMPELEDANGLHVLASAFCLLAAGAHSKDAGHQEQIGAAFYELCCSGFGDVRMDPAVKVMVEGIVAATKAKRR